MNFYYTNFILRSSSLSTFIVGSGSMVPTYNIGDLLIVKKVANLSSSQASEFNSIKVGQPILFKNPIFYNQKGQLLNIVHRVVQIYNDSSGQRIVKTKGDANTASIPKLDYPIYQRYFIGKVVYDIPKAGLIVRVFEPPYIYWFAVAIGGIIVVVILMAATLAHKKQLKRTITKNRDKR